MIMKEYDGQIELTTQSRARPQHQFLPRRYSDYHGRSTSLPPVNGLSLGQINPAYSLSGSVTPNPLTSHSPNTLATATVSTAPTFSHTPAAPPEALHPPSFHAPVSQCPATQPPLQSATRSFAHPYLHDIRLRLHDQSGVPSQYGASHPPQPDSILMLDPEPTHIEQSQGRKDKLPSFPGRAQLRSGNMIPVKDQEGKFPCIYCSKTFLHAKHLTRHFLLHTGDRPYQCKLCKGTFSRSDILKRHLQKCSIRHGIPADRDHLEGSRAHPQKACNFEGNLHNNSNFNGSNSTNTPPSFQNGAGALAIDCILGGPSFIPKQPLYADRLASLTTRISHSDSLICPGSNKNGNRRSVSSLDQIISAQTSFGEPFEFGGASITLNRMPQDTTSYTMPPALHSSSQVAQNCGHKTVSAHGLSLDGRNKAEDPPLFLPDNKAVELNNGREDDVSLNYHQLSAENNFMFSMPGDGNTVRVIESETGIISSNLAPVTLTPQSTRDMVNHIDGAI